MSNKALLIQNEFQVKVKNFRNLKEMSSAQKLRDKSFRKKLNKKFYSILKFF